MPRYALRVGVIERERTSGVTDDEPYADLALITDPQWELRGVDAAFEAPAVAGNGATGDAVPAYLP